MTTKAKQPGQEDVASIGYLEGSRKHNNVISFLEHHCRTIPNRPALLWLGHATVEAWLEDKTVSPQHESLTFGELNERTVSTAAGLADLSIGFGDTVFIFIPMSPELYTAMFAVQRLGAIAVFLDSWARREQLGMCAAQTRPKALIAPEAAFEYIRGVPELEAVDVRIVTGQHGGEYAASLEELAAQDKDCAVQAVEGKHTALITFTTGSSGPPKGANRTHRFLAAQHRAIDGYLPYEVHDVDLPVFPIFSLNNIAAGVTTVLPAINLAERATTDGEILIAQILASGATCCTLSPSLLVATAKAAQGRAIQLAGLRRCITGGAPISNDDARLFEAAAPSVELHILYGSTEVEPIAHIKAMDMPTVTGAEGVCVGTISKGLEHRFLRLHRGPIVLDEKDWKHWEVERGDVGELVVTGDHVCRDYYNNPDAFRASKILDKEGRTWHRTGDLCRMDENGRLWVVGRLHNAICRSGKFLFPVGPEIIMKRLPFVEAAAYVGLPDEKLVERAAAAFCVRPDSTSQDFTEVVREALKKEDIPVDQVFQMSSIPLDPRHHSKVEYQKLREQLINRTEGSR